MARVDNEVTKFRETSKAGCPCRAPKYQKVSVIVMYSFLHSAIKTYLNIRVKRNHKNNIIRLSNI